MEEERALLGRSEYNGELISHDPEALPTTLAASRAVVSGAGLGALQDGGYIAAATALVGAVTTTSFTVNAYSYGLLAIGAIELAFEAPDAQVRRHLRSSIKCRPRHPGAILLCVCD